MLKDVFLKVTTCGVNAGGGELELENFSNALILCEIKEDMPDFFEEDRSESRRGLCEDIFGLTFVGSAVNILGEGVSGGAGLEKDLGGERIFSTFGISESDCSFEIGLDRVVGIVGVRGLLLSMFVGFPEVSPDRFISICRGEAGENGAEGVLDNETDFASSTVALCSSSRSESSDSDGALDVSSGLIGIIGGGFGFRSMTTSFVCAAAGLIVARLFKISLRCLPSCGAFSASTLGSCCL